MKRDGVATKREILPVVLLFSFSLSSQHSWGEFSDRIPFRLEKGHILVTASLNDAEHLTFAVDTGTTYTMIDRRVALEHGLKQGRAKTVAVAGKRVKVYETQIPRLCIGQTCFESVTARICDLSSFEGLDGLLGLDLFRSVGLTLNFVENYLEFRSTEGLISSQRFVRALAFVPVRVQCGDRTLVFMLDSAGIDLILFEERIRDVISLNRTGSSHRVQGAGVSYSVEEVSVPNLSIGHLKFEDKTAYLSTQPPYGTIHGIIGLRGLGFKRLSLDYKNHRISWE
jgi:predicted aspartyl protease